MNVLHLHRLIIVAPRASINRALFKIQGLCFVMPKKGAAMNSSLFDVIGTICATVGMIALIATVIWLWFERQRNRQEIASLTRELKGMREKNGQV
jgi:hypothetical protein